jgi:hypothetical protein
MMVDKRHPGRSPRAGRGGQAAQAVRAEVSLCGFQPPVGTPFGLEVNTV